MSIDRKPQHILQLCQPDLIAEFLPLNSLAALKHNLHRQLSTLLAWEDRIVREMDNIRVVENAVAICQKEGFELLRSSGKIAEAFRVSAVRRSSKNEVTHAFYKYDHGR